MKKSVLVVDDERMVLTTVKRILEDSKIKVITANSGSECLKLVKKGFKGLILMDIIMPKMDGWDTIQAMVDNGYTEGNIICMLTGKRTPDKKMESLKEYVLDYIRKPFNNQKLVSIVKEYLSYLK
jgi:DNA-binding NtrC family response regulator